MDVTVSHLNNRLALQLPAQLPLGLVFVLGDVENLRVEKSGDASKVAFDLIEKGHRVRCLLSDRAAAEVVLNDSDKIRAGGHLTFEPTRADYYLLVRDVEVVESQAPNPLEMSPIVERSDLISVLADIQPPVDAVETPGEELPSWVKELAPPEFQGEMSLEKRRETAVSQRMNGESLSDKQLAQLSAAMDSEEEVELTNSLLEVARKLNRARGIPVTEPGSYAVPPPVTDSKAATIGDVEDPDTFRPTGSRQAERLLLLVVMVSLALFLLIMLLFITGVV